MSKTNERDRFDLNHGQEIVIRTVDDTFSGFYQRQNSNRIEISDVINLKTNAKFPFKFISKSEILETRNPVEQQQEANEEAAKLLPNKIFRKEKNEHIEKIITNKKIIKWYDMEYKQAIADISIRSLIGVATLVSQG